MTRRGTGTVIFSATLLALAFLFRIPALDLMVDWSRDEYSHGFIVPFLAALMAGHRLAEKPVQTVPSWMGLGWLAVGLTLISVGEASTFRQMAFYGMLAAVIGICLVYLGRAAVRTMAPAFLLTLFAVPLPFMVYNNVSLHMQIISTSLGVAFLDRLGVAAFQDGNVIDLGGYKLQVVEACSGLRYLLPLSCFSFLIAYLLRDAWWKRAVVFLSAIPLAIGMNALRIALIGMAADFWSINLAEGFLHTLQGFAIFMICTGLLLLEAQLLLRLEPRGTFQWSFFTWPRHLPTGNILRPTAPTKAALALVVMASLVIPRVEPRIDQPLPTTNLSQFPLELGAWRGHSGNIDAAMLRELALSDYWLADYVRDDTHPVNLYIAYYAQQNISAAAHSPSTCVPGGGWEIIDSKKIELPVPNPPWHAARLLIASGNARKIVYYWFDERGRNITDQFQAKWYLLVDQLLTHRSDGALIRLTTEIAPDENEATAEQRLRDFTTAAFPIVHARFPTTH